MSTIKPLIRWTIGPCREEGIKSLFYSVRSFIELYPDFEYVICYNQIEEECLLSVKKLDERIRLINQNDYLNSFPIKPQLEYQTYWKLYPPRLDITKHEINIDNDIIIFKKIKEIDCFLNEDAVLLYQGLHGLYGSYENSVPTGIRINSGIYGMPPNFIFKQNMPKLQHNWQDKFDEQGIVASTLMNYKKHFIIPLTTIPIIEKNFEMKYFLHDFCCGYHFVGVNY